MAFTLLKPSGIDLSQTFAFTGTVSGAGGGKVLQVQYYYTHDGISTSSTSDAATIVTDQITPSATNSKIIVQVGGGRGSNGGGAAEGDITLYRQIGGGGYSSLQVAMVDNVNHATNGGYGKPTSSFIYVDTSHNTTSAIDYKIYIKTNANTYYFNSGGSQMAMLLMEVAA
tara:strand:+ start:18 stop:527 length:510 start_codon:yes stop_codon:yes gene_type:complete